MPNFEPTQPPPLTPLAQTPAALAVLFADVVDSTRLYGNVGDTLAKMMIDECLDVIRAVVAQYGGRIIKTIGDEAMCTLATADAACLAAIDIQQNITALPAISDIKREIRVGFHFGWVIEENNDVFGDTVNLAARLSGVAKGMQIITTTSTVASLMPLMRASTRRISAVSVKGKGEEVDICEVIWQDTAELTIMTPAHTVINRRARLLLKHADQEWIFERNSPILTLGRDSNCQMVVRDPMASRLHANIEVRQGKFFLIDKSTNGTFVWFDDQSKVVLHREELMLRGKGRLTFGHNLDETTEDFACFEVRDSEADQPSVTPPSQSRQPSYVEK